MRDNGKRSSFGYLCEIVAYCHVLQFHYVQTHVQRKFYARDCTFCRCLSIAEPYARRAQLDTV
ncbi:hypothetical protein EWM60_02405 [Candidatus Erwinia dacicola]|nr:hypothetical protein [Candidatus Erwinia dacicola]NJD84900.1 hypothetical protein [Candidatus Erwinia dacicola]